MYLIVRVYKVHVHTSIFYFVQQQEEAARTHKEFVESEEVPDTSTVDMKHQSIAQIIYAENRVSYRIYKSSVC